MKKLVIRILAMLLIVCVMEIPSHYKANAASIKVPNSINIIAKNAVKYMTQNVCQNTTIADERPLYDFNGKLVAYSIDLQNSETLEHEAFPKKWTL